MMEILRYKGYIGSVRLDEDGGILHGKLEYIRALVTYEATTVKGIKKAFQEAVNSYLDLCKKENLDPEKPFKGSFNVRPGPELHRKAAMKAGQQGQSLNAFVTKALESAIEKEDQ